MSQDKQEAARCLVGTTRSLDAWFYMLNELLLRSKHHVQSTPTATEISPTDIVKIFTILRRNVSSNRSVILAELLHDSDVQGLGNNLNNALNIVIQAAYMTEISLAKRHASHNNPLGAYWDAEQSLVTFMERTYPQAEDSEGISLTATDQNALKGWKLAKKLGIEFKGTNNLADHLFYSRHRNTLYFFHHVGFLQAHLQNRAHGIPADSDMKTCLEM